jgi:hypothetical protein
MKHLALICALLAPTIASADRVVQGDKSGTFDCSKDPEISIQSGEGAFTFTGTCDKIAVNGGNNKLTIESVKKLAIVGDGNTAAIERADKIGVTGSNNAVSYKGTVSGKGKTAVGSVGLGNKIKKS